MWVRGSGKCGVCCVDLFRYLSRQSTPELCVDVSPGGGDHAGDLTTAGSSLDWRGAERSRDVCSDDVDVAGLDATGMGAFRRRAGLFEIRDIQLLDEQLLGRRRGGNRRRTRLGRVAENFRTAAVARRLC